MILQGEGIKGRDRPGSRKFAYYYHIRYLAEDFAIPIDVAYVEGEKFPPHTLSFLTKVNDSAFRLFRVLVYSVDDRVRWEQGPEKVECDFTMLEEFWQSLDCRCKVRLEKAYKQV